MWAWPRDLGCFGFYRMANPRSRAYTGPVIQYGGEIGTLHDIIMWVPFCETATCTFFNAKGSKITLMVYVYRVFSPSPLCRSYGIPLCKSFHSIFDVPEWHRAIGAVNLRLLDLSVSPFRVSRIRARLYSSFRGTMNDLLGDTNIQRNNILNILSSVKEKKPFSKSI